MRLLEDYFAAKGITCAFISPQILRLFKNKSRTLKKVSTGSERVSMLAGDGYELYNCYGSSETAATALSYKVEGPMENTPIGKPLEGFEIFLLDEDGKEVADGEEGEICIKGILAESYLNLEEQTAKTFIRQENGSILLHTGDMGRRMPDGNYVYVNRRDWMVKINGQRVETGEIELRISSMAEVESAVVKAFEDENGQNYLCAYYVSAEEIKVEQLRAYLKETLPDYMIPRFFKRLDSLPKNVNGKLDRTVLILCFPLADICSQIFRMQAHHRRSLVQGNVHAKRWMHGYCLFHSILKFIHINSSWKLTAHRNMFMRNLSKILPNIRKHGNFLRANLQVKILVKH